VSLPALSFHFVCSISTFSQKANIAKRASDGEKKIIVPPDIPVVRFVPGNSDDLKPGAQIFIVAGQKMPDGTITAPAINVGRDGVAPPM
jgi:hypothetical protein